MKSIFYLAFTAVLVTGFNGIWPGSLIRTHLNLGLEYGQAHAADPLKAGMIDPKTGKKIKYWAAPMDPTYIRNEPGKSPMGMDLVPVYEAQGGEKEPSSTIRIDPVTRQNMGVRMGVAGKKILHKSIRAFGTVTFDETRLYAVNTKFDGWIEKLHVNFLGDRVKKGQPLFEIYAPELLSAQQEYLLGLQQRDTLSANASPGVRKGIERLLNAARTRLEYWDLASEQIEQIERDGKIRKSFTVYSPADGVVIKKQALEGHYVKAGAHQYEIADLSTVWVDVDIYEYELPWVTKGMPAEMELAYLPGDNYFGQVLYVYPYLESKTRTARLRLEFKNDDTRLKPGMYANVYLKARLPEKVVVIPLEAVIDSGVRQIVFVSRGKGRFEPREIRLGVEGDRYEVQVKAGLNPGEAIVVSGQFMLDSESRLQEAIGKMIQARQQPPAGAEAPDDLDVSSLSMESDLADDDLDMTDLKMDEPQTTKD